ncbi:pickpocket protein 28 [Drosophila madeirensis]|uniref:Pickpocket protein 28 n=1 Tax=Drosophila madeirensis TaxID=30013 RepID=A0AAU9FX64_DROMD
MAKSDLKHVLSSECVFGVAKMSIASMVANIIQDAWDKWNTTLEIMGIDPKLRSITTQPFPAVVILNVSQALVGRAAALAAGAVPSQGGGSAGQRGSAQLERVHNKCILVISCVL